MPNVKTIFGFNGLILLLVLALSALLGGSIDGLFLPPCRATFPGAGLFFLMFQMLFYLSVMVCIFSFGILRIVQPGRPENRLILGSALLIGFFLLNEVFRTHIHLGRAGFPKWTILIIYLMAGVTYALTFRRQIKSTPYPLLLSGVALLLAAFFAEALPLKDEGLASLIEGIPKLLSAVNIALYFWTLCQHWVLRALNFSEAKLPSS